MRTCVLSDVGVLTLTDRTRPTVGADEALVRVERVGICGSDIHYYRNGENGGNVVEFLVTGGGPIGQLVSEVAMWRGAESVVLTDVVPEKLDLAKRRGVERSPPCDRRSRDSTAAVEPFRNIDTLPGGRDECPVGTSWRVSADRHVSPMG